MGRRIATSALVLALGCVLGYRGTADLDVQRDLAGVVAVSIDLPSTPITVVGCDAGAPAACPDALLLVGRVHSTGGTAAEARDNAGELELVLETLDGLLSVRADVPLPVRGLVELEIEQIDMPSDRDLDVDTSLGDIAILGMRGAITVDVDTGNVIIEGGDGGVSVELHDGTLEMSTPGIVDVDVASGDVTLVQTGDARDVHIDAHGGDVTIELASAADLALDVSSDGTIRVTTDTIVAITDDDLVRTVGEGTTRIDVDASGDVTIRQRMPG
jgi:hypothetical protein